MVSESFWHFSDCLAKVLMTEEELNATDQLLISGLIFINHKISTRNGLSVFFPGKCQTGKKAGSDVRDNFNVTG